MAVAGDFDVIVHGCNCHVKMGAGIAKQIRSQFPEAYYEDQAFAKKFDRPEDKLGYISYVHVPRSDGSEFVIVNAYTQIHPGKGSLSYEALAQCFDRIRNQFPAARIGYPAIGAGLAGGDWNVISEIIENSLDGCDHVFVQYEDKGR